MAMILKNDKGKETRTSEKSHQKNKKKHIEKQEHVGDEIGNLNPYEQDRDVIQGVDPNSRFI